MKRPITIRLTESDLKKLVKQVLKETNRDIDDDTYFGGGVPSGNNNILKYTAENEVAQIYENIKPYLDKLTDIFNNYEVEDNVFYTKAMGILENVDYLPKLAKHFYKIEL